MRHKRGYHYRCRDYTCHTRVTLLHLYEWYKRKPKCKWCGSKKFKKEEFKHIDPFYRDRYRDDIEINVTPCKCDGYGHVAMRDPAPPHRIGSKCCEYRKDGTKRLPGDPDYHNPYVEEDLYEDPERNDPEMPEAPILEVCPVDDPSYLEWQEAYFGRFGTGSDESVLCGNALGSSQEGNAGADCCRNLERFGIQGVKDVLTSRRTVVVDILTTVGLKCSNNHMVEAQGPATIER